MPRFPTRSSAGRAMPASVFDRLMPRVRASGQPLVPLHLGDTVAAPPAAARLGALGFTTADDPPLYRYAPPPGDQALLTALVDELRARNHLDVEADQLLVTAGATHGLAVALRALLDPGDELLLCAPYWPLIPGIARSAGIVPVDAPLSQRLYGDSTLDPAELVEGFVTARTAAIYLASPNNPDGKVLSRDQLGRLLDLAERHDLWIFADEVYQHHLYDGREHVSMASLPGAAARTISAFSFSKSFAQAGLRVGYLAAPREAAAAVRSLGMHTVYNVPVAMQRAALAALGDAGFVDQTRARYQALRDQARAWFGLPCQLPDGATYLFLDLSPYQRAGEVDAVPVLERLADVGVLLAPGAIFGAPSHARLCFTAVAPDELERGLALTARVLAG